MRIRTTNVADLTLENLQQQILQLKRMIEDLPAGTGKRFTNATVSPNYSSGNSGWKIGENGDVEFNDGNFRGDITGASGTFSGSLAAGVSITAPTITGGNISGTTITGGTITGATVQTATSGERVVLSGSGLLSYDSSALRAAVRSDGFYVYQTDGNLRGYLRSEGSTDLHLQNENGGTLVIESKGTYPVAIYQNGSAVATFLANSNAGLVMQNSMQITGSHIKCTTSGLFKLPVGTNRYA